MRAWNPPIMTIEDHDEPRLTAHVANLGGRSFNDMHQAVHKPSVLWCLTFAESYYAYREALDETHR